MASTSLDLSQIRTDALSSGATFRTLIGLGSGDSPTYKGIVLATGTITSDTPALNITQTWNNNAVAFTGIKFNATNSGSNSFTLIADWQIGGVQKFAVSKDGYVSTNRIGAIGSGQNVTFESNNTQIGDGGTASLYVSNTFNVAQLTSTVAFGWCSGNSSSTNLDLILRRDAANTLALRNSSNQQRFNLYGTYSDGANYRRLYLDSTTAGAFTIGVEGAGTGASGNTLTVAAPTTLNSGLTVTLSGSTVLQCTSTDNMVLGKKVWVSGAGTNYYLANGTNGWALAFGSGNNANSVSFGVRSDNEFAATSSGEYVWTSLAYGASQANPTIDLRIARDAANTLALRNSTNQQRFNLYGTYTNASNYRRLYLDSTTAGAFTIGVEGLGTGATGNTLELQTGGTSRLTIDASGNCGIGTTSPSQKLDVRGNLLVTTGTTTGVQLSRGTGTYTWQGPSMYLFSDPAIGLGTYGGLYWSGLNGGNADAYNFSNGLLLFSDGSGGLSIATTLTNNPAPIRFFTGGYALSNERMRLNPIGNLGLGTTSPLAKLDIADTWNSNVSVTGASGTGTTATLTFSAMTTAFPVGSTIVVTSVNPSGYNGTFTVTASSTTSVSYLNATTGAYVSGGTIQQLFTALKVNVTDTSSDAGSLLMDLQVGGVSQFKVTKTGGIDIAPKVLPLASSALRIATLDSSGTTYATYISSQHYFCWKSWDPIQSGQCRISTDGIVVTSASYLGWSSQSVDVRGGPDTVLYRDAANTLAQRNSTNAQAFRIYRTADGSPGSNYQRLALSSTTYSGAFYQTILCESAGTGGDNINLVLSPKGTGAILAQVPDGTATGGNARGQYAVDLQTVRTANTQVASADYSSIIGGSGNTASGQYSLATGRSCVASGMYSLSGGYLSSASSDFTFSFGYISAATAAHSVCISRQSTVSVGYGAAIGGIFHQVSGTYGFIGGGYQNTVSGSLSAVMGGSQTLADRRNQVAFGAGMFATQGDAQKVEFVLRIKTTDATATSLRLGDDTTRLTIPSGKVFAFVAKISGIKSDGSAVAFYTRKGCIKNVGGATSLIGAIETIGTDVEDNTATDVAITADDTNDALQINVTGITGETWRWVAVVEGVEIGYGT